MKHQEKEAPTSAEIERVVGLGLRVKRRVREKNGPHAVADCPFCGKISKCYVNLDTGLWDCKVCEEGGSLWKLADKVGIRVRSDDRKLVKHFASVIADGNTRKKIALDVPVRDALGLDLAAITTASQRCFDEADKAGAAVRAYLTSRCIEDDTIRRFKLGVSWIRDKGTQPELALGIPYLVGDKVPLLKMRNLEADKDKRKFRRTAGGDSLLFNAEGIKGCRQVVLVEGELDAISLWQLGVHNVASTSLGAKKTLPDEWLALLADADDIVLWYDDDDKGQEVVASVATQLGTYRCRLAQMPTGLDAKDANDLMMRLPQDEAAEVVARVIAEARSLVLSNVVMPSHFADALAQEIMDGEKTLGVSTGWPEIDRSIMGIRMGELTMVTGHTAHGKTSWSLDLVNNLAKQGVPVLVSALENGPLSIARKIFQKIFHMSPASLITDEHKQRALQVLGLLDKDPLFILDLYGLHSIDEIIDQVRFAVRRHGIKVFMFDHLHFLKVGARDMVQHYDEALHKLNALKVELQIHIIVVAHPRGSVLDDVVPMGGDIKGCSSAKQIADNGFSVFRAQRVIDTKKELKIKDSMGRVVEVTLEPFQSLIVCWKARHDDASEDSTILFYNPRSVTYTSQEARDAPIQGAINGQTNQAQDDEDDLFS